jgi:hypothetical protein
MKGITEFKGYISQLGFDALEGKFVYHTLPSAFTATTELPATQKTADVMPPDSDAKLGVSEEVKSGRRNRFQPRSD